MFYLFLQEESSKNYIEVNSIHIKVNIMVIYTVPAYIPTFQQAYPYGYPQQLIYPGTAVVTTPPTVIAAPPGGGVVIRPPGYTPVPVVVQQVPAVQVVAYQVINIFNDNQFQKKKKKKKKSSAQVSLTQKK